MQHGVADWHVARTLEALIAVWCAKIPSLPSPAAGVMAVAVQMIGCGCLARFLGYGCPLANSSNLVALMQLPLVRDHQIGCTCFSGFFCVPPGMSCVWLW